MTKGKKLQVCSYCKKVIRSMPFRIRHYGKIYKYSFAHKLCLDKQNEII